MKKTGAFGLSAGAARILHIIIYCIFLCYSIYLIQNAPNEGAQTAYIAITVIMLSVAIFYEYLQYHFEQAIKALNYECDPKKSKSIFDAMQKKDIAHAYKNQRIIYNVLYDLAMYQTEDAINLIQSNDRIFRGDIDQLLIRNASIFLANIEADNKTAAKKAYPDVIKLKGAKVKGKKLAALYNWDELEALNYYISNDFKKAVSTYEKVQTNFMNHRELTQYYYYYALALDRCGRKQEAQEKMNELLKIGNRLPICEKARSFMS